MASVVPVAGVSSLSGGQLRSLENAAKAIGIPVDWLATIISFETGGSFDPRQLNRAGSGAFGLIQFLPSTAANLLGGTQADAVARGMAMSFDEQLQKMVVPYFRSFGKSFGSLQDLYLAVLYPALMGKPDSAVMATAPSITYTQNAGLDRGGKGYITRGDIVRTITARYESAGAARVPIPQSVFVITVATLAAAAGIWFLQPYLPPETRLPAAWAARIQKGINMAKKKMSAIVPLAILGVLSFGWLVLKGKV